MAQNMSSAKLSPGSDSDNSVNSVNPVDEMLPPGKLFTFGLQHVLVMYAGAVAVPLILGSALKMDQEHIMALINADLFTCGIATLIQTLGFWKFGARMPLIQGCSFVALAPMILIGQDYGITAIYGSVIACGLLTVALAPVFSRLVRFFPPVVVGCVITSIGLSLMPAAAIWLGGGNPNAADFGSLAHLGLGLFTVLITVIIYSAFSGLIGNLSVLLGMILGTAVAFPLGMTDFSEVANVGWVAITTPFRFGFPKFSLAPTLSLMAVMLIIMTETTGNCLAIGRMVGRKITPQVLGGAFRADGISTVLGGIFNSFPYNAFTQNTGLISLSGVKSRYVVAAAGVILLVMGIFPKVGAIISCVPTPVLGGSGIVMFGMTAAGGIQELKRVKYDGTRNALIVAISLSLGVLPSSFPALFSHITGSAKLFLESGIFLAGASAVVLNLILNRKGDTVPDEKPAAEDSIDG